VDCSEYKVEGLIEAAKAQQAGQTKAIKEVTWLSSRHADPIKSDLHQLLKTSRQDCASRLHLLISI
jgi:hypothetical protein